MKAVSNSSVLIALSAIGQLSLLHQRFSDGILIPQAMWHKVVATGAGRPGAKVVAAAPYIQIQSLADTALSRFLQAELDEGEAEAIALFIEKPVEALLLDEKSARRVARRMSLPVLGTVGILIWARQMELIPNLREQLDALIHEGQFRLSQRVYAAALSKVGENA